ncbi:MAG: hypothetical protein CL607_06170 [Anaerolineaceae bacterium]|nr:hypothetical protein [Anaerolineaceae bacterium]
MERSIIVTVALSIVALLVVLELVRRRKLREEYSLLWLFTAAVMLIVSIWRDLLHGLSKLVGIAYPPNLLFLLAILLMLFILLYYSIIITRLTHENKTIAQDVALLRYEIEQLRITQNRLANGLSRVSDDQSGGNHQDDEAQDIERQP